MSSGQVVEQDSASSISPPKKKPSRKELKAARRSQAAAASSGTQYGYLSQPASAFLDGYPYESQFGHLQQQAMPIQHDNLDPHS
eukprot:3201763-Karenia_brevis.AAC.1